MKKLLLVNIILCMATVALTQHTTKRFIQDGKNYTYESFNEVSTPRALLVLFNGGAGIASEIPKETSLPDSAVTYGMKTIGIDQSEFYIADSTYVRIRTIIAHVMKSHGIHNNLFIGGFSIGGFTAIRWSEMAVERNDQSMIPNALFAIDPPLDHLEMHQYCLRELNNTCDNVEANRIGKGEAHWILDYYRHHFGTLPQDSNTFIHHSCFTAHLSNGGNAKYLRTVPVNMVHEIDLMWLITERCRDLDDANIWVSSQFVNYLYNHGNKNATITLTSNQGYRSDGRRHPHSWSIATPTETLDWLIKYQY